MINILLVEDFESDYRIFIKYLKSISDFKSEVDWVQNIEVACEKLTTKEYDLIITDLGLPGYEGIEVLEEISKVSQRKPIIVLSGQDNDEFLDQASHMGVYDYLVKSDLNERFLRRSIRYTLGRFKSDLEHDQTKADLLHSQKLDALGKLTGGIAHDINNKLAVVLSITENVLRMSSTNDDIKASMKLINSSIGSTTSLIRQLLAFSRKQEINKIQTSINDLLTNNFELISRLVPANINITLDLCDDHDLWVNVDRSQIELVITNVVLNAKDAISVHKGSILISTQLFKKDDNNEEYVHIQITDNGPGMTDEQIKKAVEPFFTTKKLSESAGLGLSVVDGIIAQHDGLFNITSSSGEGTTVSLLLKRVNKVDDIQEVNKKNEVENYQPTILYAEDEDLLRELTVDTLQMYGFDVIAAEDGEVAYGLYLENKDKIEIVLSDVVMPNLGGLELMNKIRAHEPSLGFIFLTGYSGAKITGENGEIPPFAEILTKPCIAEDLINRLSSYITRAGQFKAS